MGELHAYYSESWFTAAGAALKLRRLKRLGIPDLTNWRFITTTVADRSCTPQEAFERGSDKMRRFFAKWRKVIGDFKWCWKLEFHEADGYPHWHIALGYTKRVPQEMLEEIESWWGLGRVKVQRIKGEEMAYLFKYIAKSVDDLPDWVAHYKGRLRIFQTSKGFYTNRQEPVEREKKPAQTCMLPTSFKQRDEWDKKKGLIRTETKTGLVMWRMVRLRIPFEFLLLARCQQALQRQIPLAVPGAIELSQNQITELIYEHKRTNGHHTIPSNLLFAAA